MTEGDQGRKAERLHDFRELERNEAWQEIAARMKAAHAEHLEAVSDRARSTDKRAEHLEAFHLARELDGWAARRSGELERDLMRAAQQAAEISGRVADELG